MYLNSRVGPPTTPADPATIVDRANRLFDYAAHAVGVLDALDRARTSSPAPASRRRGRRRTRSTAQNVLALPEDARRARRAAVPARQQHAVHRAARRPPGGSRSRRSPTSCREMYFNAKRCERGADRSATAEPRRRHADAVGALPRDRDPAVAARRHARLPDRNGATAGRAGLQPAQAWFDVVKWQALAARQVAPETGFSTIWSWGWDVVRRPRTIRTSRRRRASGCGRARRRSATARGAAGAGWNSSPTEGQLALPRGNCSARRQGQDLGVVDLPARSRSPATATLRTAPLFARADREAGSPPSTRRRC